MNYEEAMSKRCSCGKYCVGGWYGFKDDGRPMFSRVSSPRILYGCIGMTEEHTLNACYSPRKIPKGKGL